MVALSNSFPAIFSWIPLSPQFPDTALVKVTNGFHTAKPSNPFSVLVLCDLSIGSMITLFFLKIFLHLTFHSDFIPNSQSTSSVFLITTSTAKLLNLGIPRAQSMDFSSSTLSFGDFIQSHALNSIYIQMTPNFYL